MLKLVRGKNNSPRLRPGQIRRTCKPSPALCYTLNSMLHRTHYRRVASRYPGCVPVSGGVAPVAYSALVSIRWRPASTRPVFVREFYLKYFNYIFSKNVLTSSRRYAILRIVNRTSRRVRCIGTTLAPCVSVRDVFQRGTFE